MTVNHQGPHHQVIDAEDQLQRHVDETPGKESCYDKH